MFIIPIGHDESRPAKLPFVTLAIIAICLVVHLLVRGPAARAEAASARAMERVLEFYVSHGTLKLDEDISALVFRSRKEKMLEELLPELAPAESIPLDEASRAAAQRELDARVARYREALAASPYAQWGLIPSRIQAKGLLGCMFLHAGWVHLIANMFILFVLAPLLEGVWGRTAFASVYLAAGVFASLMFALGRPDSGEPMIGASGAIAGVMGAFLVRCWNTRIKFFYSFFLRGGTFEAPSWVMLPLWFLGQVFHASMTARLDVRGQDSVAYLAHVWGFLFGMAAAWLVRTLRLEERRARLSSLAMAPAAPAGPSALEEARRRIEAGDKEQAYLGLLAAAKKTGGNAESIEFLWHLGAQLGRDREAARFVIRLAERELTERRFAEAIDHFRLVRGVAADEVAPGLRLPLIEALIRLGDREGARAVYDETVRSRLDRMPAVLLARLLENARALDEQLGTAHMAAIAGACMGCAEIPEGQKRAWRQLLKNPPAVPPDRKIEIEQKPAIMAVPVELAETGLLVDAERIGRQRIELRAIRAFALVRIVSPHAKPFYLLDLFTRLPTGRAPAPQSIRLLSSDFSARSLFPECGEETVAFRRLVGLFLDLPGIATYPGFTTSRIASIPVFASVSDYEKSYGAEAG